MTMRRTVILVIVLALLLIAVCIDISLRLVSAAREQIPPISSVAHRQISPMGVGSVRHATEWRERFRTLSKPEAAKRAYPEIVEKRFDNGEWIFGICEDSHTSPEGGTIVVKDSNGRIRAFFGHVCGSTWLAFLTREWESLADLDTSLRSGPLHSFHFGEYLFPTKDGEENHMAPSNAQPRAES
jgi:hypothetical protein